jgi:hypothetical protein
MIRILIPLVVIAAIAWFIAKRSRDTRATLLIIASVPVGGFIGGYCGSGICYLFLRLAGRGGSHNDLIPFAAAGMLGMVLGAIASPVIACFLTQRKQK